MTDYYSVVLDENERQRMLAEGYLPDIIDRKAKQRYEAMVDDFRWKNLVLGRFYEPTPYYAFVADVFPDLEQLMVVTGESSYAMMGVDELMDYHATRNDVYVCPASFINGCYSSACCKDIYAFVIDLDGIEHDVLKNVIDDGTIGVRVPQPTYIVNSGSGVHLYYVFREPVPHYFRNQKVLKTMYNKLCGITDKTIWGKTDWHAITQPFRLPGTLTKLGELVTGWKLGEKWDVHALAARLKVDAEELDLQRMPLLSQREFKVEKARRIALMEAAQAEIAATRQDQQQKKRKKRKLRVSAEGGSGFYIDCLQRCYSKTKEGSRYRSMMALTVVAYKTEYPKKKLEEDLRQLLKHYNTFGKSMKPSEVQKALRMYNPKALKTKATTLEAWFGWEFPRLSERLREKRLEADPNRPKLSREEILEEARAIRDIRMKRQGRTWQNKSGAPTREQEVKAWRAENPEGTPKDCIWETGISKNTVYKWWKG